MKYLILTLLGCFVFTQVYSQSNSNFSISFTNIKSDTEIKLVGKPLYLLGVVTPASAKLIINNVVAKVDTDGAFICYSPVVVKDSTNDKGYHRGEFDIKIISGSISKTFKKFIWVKLPPKTSPSDTLVFDSTWQTKPERNITIRNSGLIKVEVKGTPDSRAYFTIDSINTKFPMVETKFINSYYWGEAVFGSGFTTKGDTINGIYQGAVYLNKPLDSAKITVYLTNPKLGKIKEVLPANITITDSPIYRIVQVENNSNKVTARYGPKMGYKLFLEGGVKLKVSGEEGNWISSKLSSDQTIFVAKNSVMNLALGTPPPNATVQLIRVKNNNRQVKVSLGLSERVPVEIREFSNPQRIELLVYNTTANIDWVFYDTSTSLIKEIKHFQTSDNVLKVIIYLNEKTQWGYYIDYSGTTFELKINKPAKHRSGFIFPANQLKGRVIVLDPGHNPDTGAIGPRGLEERNINFVLAKKLQKLLEDDGAIVYLTRKTITEPLPLLLRRKTVVQYHPEISISIHNNAVPQGVNPIKHNGFSVYYYYPQALPLAKMIHRNFEKNLGLKNFGLYWDNLYMCRITEAISLLVEPSFIIMPRQESLLETNKFQNKIVKSIFDAIKQFYKEYSQ